MKASLNFRDRTLISVSVTEVSEHTDDEVLEVALDVAGETRARLFGWSVERSHEIIDRAHVIIDGAHVIIDGAIVYLYTD